MFYALNAALAIVVFLFLVNGLLQGTKTAQIQVWLGGLWLGCLIAAFLFFGVKSGFIATGLSLAYATLLGPIAARLAARLMAAGSPEGGGAFPGIPSRKLGRISSDLGTEQSTEEMLAEMLGPKPSRKDRALETLLDLVEKSPATKVIMDRHGATRETLREKYWQLQAAGAGQWAGAHYASASALAYPDSLEFVLSAPKRGLTTMEVAYGVVAHFQSGSPLPNAGP